MVNPLKRFKLTGATLGTAIGLIVTFYLMVYLVQTIKTNYELQDQINVLQQQNANLGVEQDSLKYKIQYYQTEEYKEKEARAKLGLQQPGEGVIILPRDGEPITKTDEGPKPAKKSNFAQWMAFLRGEH